MAQIYHSRRQQIHLQDVDRIERFYERIAERIGPQKARVATAKEMLVIIWYMLIKNEPYRTMNQEMVERKYKKMERESNMV